MKNVRHITPTQITMNIAGPLAERMQQCTLSQFKASVIHAIGKTDLAPRLAEPAVATEVNTAIENAYFAPRSCRRQAGGVFAAAGVGITQLKTLINRSMVRA